MQFIQKFEIESFYCHKKSIDHFTRIITTVILSVENLSFRPDSRECVFSFSGKLNKFILKNYLLRKIDLCGESIHSYHSVIP